MNLHTAEVRAAALTSGGHPAANGYALLIENLRRKQDTKLMREFSHMLCT